MWDWRDGQTMPLINILSVQLDLNYKKTQQKSSTSWVFSWILGSIVTLQPNHSVHTAYSTWRAIKQQMVNCTVKNKFSLLEFGDDDLSNHWVGLKQAWHESCDEVLCRRVSNRKECLSEESWSLITQRKCFKEMNECKEQARKKDLASLHRQ